MFSSMFQNKLLIHFLVECFIACFFFWLLLLCNILEDHPEIDAFVVNKVINIVFKILF
jgi:hypothetical protein